MCCKLDGPLQPQKAAITFSLFINNFVSIWYSFFDPLLRVFHLKKLIQNKKKIANNAQKNNFSEDENNYFSFLKEEELTRAFSKIYKDDK